LTSSSPIWMFSLTESATFSGLTSGLMPARTVSGDWIPLKLPKRIQKHFTKASVISAGGTTENAIWSIYYPVTTILKEWKSIPYGYPLANQTIYIMDNRLKLCPVGVKGEICIGGAGVAEGYYNNEEKTKRSFVEHPIYKRIYRTGDYGIFTKQGYIEFLGRKDNQVKIKGFRIELGEIEAQILKYKGVRSVVTKIHKQSSGRQTICAYYLANSQIDKQKLHKYLETVLPNYMVPEYLMQLETFPLSPNGKVDRKLLPEPNVTKKKVANLTIETQIEKQIKDICKKIINIEDFRTTDNFFDIGCDSFMLIKMHAEIDKIYPKKIRVQDIFSHSDVCSLARLISGNDDKTEKHEDEELENIFNRLENNDIDEQEALKYIERLSNN
ncbi:MAG: non-ribosomal peptide synthetase, partial [Proteobacteria bacterium]|nr:non-ribosomal peptide synthetase [Pseudomonadota bacterium]